VLTLDQLGISEEDWNQTPASVRTALMFLLQQNQRLENGLKLGLGSVSAIQRRISNALDRPVKTARQYIHQQPVNHVDETGWPEGENQKWLWINAAAEVTVFSLLKGRGTALV